MEQRQGIKRVAGTDSLPGWALTLYEMHILRYIWLDYTQEMTGAVMAIGIRAETHGGQSGNQWPR